MRRSPIASSRVVVPGCGIQSCVVRQGEVNGATPALDVGPVKVEFCGLVKLTWNFQRNSALEPGSTLMTKLGEPAGGCVAPSKSEGSQLAYVEFTEVKLKCTSAGADAPASIALRSNAATSGPMNAWSEL